MKQKMSAILATALLVLPAAASAVPVDLTIGETPIVQQTDNSPCVIGNPSCNNPALFDFTLIPSNTDAGDLDSPEYTVQQIRDIVGDTFVIGIDLQENDDLYGLELFTLSIGGVVEFTFGPQQLTLTNHGNGFSDYALSGFDLSAFSGASTAVFHLTFSSADAAREQFFLAAGSGSNAVPEPATLTLLSLGAVAAVRRRRA